MTWSKDGSKLIFMEQQDDKLVLGYYDTGSGKILSKS